MPELELGGVWIGYYPRGESEDFLKYLIPVPDNIKIFSLIAVGYPNEKKTSRSQYENVKIHYKKW